MGVHGGAWGCRQRITTEYHVYPSFGKRLFFELKVTNPFSREDTFVIHAEDPRHELRVVTDSNEWRFLRRVRDPRGACVCLVAGTVPDPRAGAGAGAGAGGRYGCRWCLARAATRVTRRSRMA